MWMEKALEVMKRIRDANIYGRQKQTCMYSMYMHPQGSKKAETQHKDGSRAFTTRKCFHIGLVFVMCSSELNIS
jgi:hypothetical protein